MQIVINVDYELYEYFSKRRSMHDDGYFSHVGKLIKVFRDGILLPKGHGKLVDVKSIPEEDRNITVKSLLYPGTIAHAGSISLEEYINKLPAIIKSDNENEE